MEIGGRVLATKAAIMPVPKAAVDEDDLASRREDEIGRAGKIAPMQSVSIAQRMN